MTTKRVPDFTPNAGRAKRFTPQGLAEDGFVPTTHFQLSDVRNYGKQQATLNSVDAVIFGVKWTHQFESDVTVDNQGFIVDYSADLSPEQLWREVEKIQG